MLMLKFIIRKNLHLGKETCYTEAIIILSFEIRLIGYAFMKVYNSNN